MHFACTIEYARSFFTTMNCAPMNCCSRHYHLVNPRNPFSSLAKEKFWVTYTPNLYSVFEVTAL